MSDLADLLKELEQVAKDTNLKEVKKEPLEESVASEDDVTSLFEGLEAAYTESKIEEEIANRLSEEDERKLGAFSGFMESVTELTNQSTPQKAIENLFATVAPPQPPVEVSDEPVVEEVTEVIEEPTEVEEVHPKPEKKAEVETVNVEIQHFSPDGTLIAAYPDYDNFGDAFVYARRTLGHSETTGEVQTFLWRGKKYHTEHKDQLESDSTDAVDTLNVDDTTTVNQ